MKHLANCTNTEFLKQAMQVREPLKAWLERTGIPAIRARKPETQEDMTEEQLTAARLAQARANTAEMFDAALRLDFDGTLRLLCLATFTDPDEFDDHPLPEYLQSVNEMLNSSRVVDFFTLYL